MDVEYFKVILQIKTGSKYVNIFTFLYVYISNVMYIRISVFDATILNLFYPFFHEKLFILFIINE
jgi:hypothetical protein